MEGEDVCVCVRDILLVYLRYASFFQVDNFMHADMHPGNILVRVQQHKSSQKRIFKSKPHVIFLDVGMTAELSQNDKLNLLEFFKAVARRDGSTAAQCTLNLSKKQNCPNPDAFVKVNFLLIQISFSFSRKFSKTWIRNLICLLLFT